MPVYGSIVHTKSKGNYKIHYSKSTNAIPYASKTYKTEEQFTETIKKFTESNKWEMSKIVYVTNGAWVSVTRKGE